jgi:hypothetical protein
MQLIYSTEVTLSFHTILEDTSIYPTLARVQKFRHRRNRDFVTQPFTNSNFHSLITMEPAAYKTLIKGLKFCFSNRASFQSALQVTSQPMRWSSSTCTSVQPFSNALYHFWHAAHSTRHQVLSKCVNYYFIQKTHKAGSTLRPSTRIKLTTTSSIKINLRFAILTQA